MRPSEGEGFWAILSKIREELNLVGLGDDANVFIWNSLGRKHALEAHDLNPTSIAILKILCSTTGRLAEESGLRDKINLGFEFKVGLRLFLGFPDATDLCYSQNGITHCSEN